MKKWIMTFVCAAAAWCAGAAPQEVDFGKLPQNAQDFVHRYFSNEKVRRVEMDRESTWDKYTVYFNSGNSVSFEGGSGDCTRIVMSEGHVPGAVLPNGVKSYLNRKYPSNAVSSYETTSDGCRVGLSNGVSLYFDQNGEFVKATE